MYGACMVHVLCMYGAYMVHVWCMYDACIVLVWCIFGILYGANCLLCELKQRLWIVSNQALFLSCVIDAKERQDVGTVDVPGAFLQTKSEGEIIIQLDRQMAMQLARINPKYAKNMVEEKGQKVIHGKANKALYGTLNASLLFWKDLIGTIGKWKFGDDNDGFILNPYDTCVANCVINGKQCTILWHVDDLKISHEDPAVVTDILWQLNDKYGKITPMVSTRGTLE